MCILNWFYDFGSWLMKPGCYALFMGSVITITGLLTLILNIISWKVDKNLDTKKTVGSTVYTIIGVSLIFIAIIIIQKNLN